MKSTTTTTILSSLLLALVSASPIARAPTSQIDVTGFTAQTEPNGDGASISFTVSIPSVSISGTSCAYSDATSLNRLPDVPMTPCSDASLRFQFRQDPAQYPGAGEGRYRLVVVYTPAGDAGIAGYHEWDPSDFVASSSGGGEELVYAGAPDFTLTPA
ncbi:hypothetical protein F5X96DRAFT_668546 [Biscogniauxia mediterranea]|nr:hypothetical protein F5X96DRAFT_668546 [Biscogniauxia mediterranea]